MMDVDPSSVPAAPSSGQFDILVAAFEAEETEGRRRHEEARGRAAEAKENRAERKAWIDSAELRSLRPDPN